MSPYRAALLALIVVGGALVAATPAGATSGVDATHDAIGATGAQVDEIEERVGIGAALATAPNGSTNNSTLGADISSFMQSSAAETDGAVKTGMWTAAFNSTENRSVRKKLVERRTSELRTELADLQERKQELLAEREAENVSETAYKAKISRLIGQINALKASINATSSRAKEVNTNVEALENLRTEVKNLTGPEISSVARNVTGVGIGNATRGPPGNVGNGNGADNAGNGNGNGASDAGNGNGQSDVGNGTAGPPNDAGPGNNTTAVGPRNNTTDVGTANDTNDVGQNGPPSDSANAPMVDNQSRTNQSGIGNGSATSAGNHSAEATGNGSTASASNDSAGSAGNSSAANADDDSNAASAFSTVTTVTADFVESLAGLSPIADALDVRTYAVTHALAAS